MPGGNTSITEEVKASSDGSKMALAWLVKNSGLVVLLISFIWFQATLKINLDLVLKQVAPIPQIALDVARLKDKNGLTFIGPTQNAVAIIGPKDSQEQKNQIVEKCQRLFGKSNAAYECIKTLQR